MQSVSDAFSVEEVDTTRKIAQSVQVAWKKDFRSGITFFTIGVSSIGGNDIIPGPAGVVSAWNKYRYQDESTRVISISYERELNEPVGGLVKTLADVKLDNTSGRYTPRYAGGNSELFTVADKPRRPMIINAGFNMSGTDIMLPQFVGVTTKPALIDMREKTATLQGADFIDYLQNRYVDTEVMFTSQRSDVVIKNILTNNGFGTAQYELDTGIQVIPFGLFEKGTRFSDIIHDIVQAENGNFYQDEEGVLRFENRQHYSGFPYFNVQRIISTAQVLEQSNPDTDQIINVVEVNGGVIQKQPEGIIAKLINLNNYPIPAGGSTSVFVEFPDPALTVTSPSASGVASYYKANTLSDGTGTDLTSSILLTRLDKFAKAAKLTFSNSSSSIAYLSELVITGRYAKKVRDLYYRTQDDSSVTAYEERPYSITNDYIQDDFWAQSLAQMVLNDYSNANSIQTIKIRAIPELQMGDLISWQGHYWRIFGIKTEMNADSGFTQELKILQRTIVTYFRIGISTIGGSDKIAP